MATKVNYDDQWEQALNYACGGDHHGILDFMELGRQRFALKEAFQQYLLKCYCDHVRSEFGPALAPVEDVGVLQLKAALVNRWKTTDLPSSDKKGIMNALTGELSTFRLPEEAYAVVAFLENGTLIDAIGRPHPADMLSEMVKHHRPDRLTDQ